MNSISNQTYINTWLYTTIVMVVLMILIGGITRLTDSGLSMVEWRPIWGFLPPITDEEWKRVLDNNWTSSFLRSKFAIKKMLRNKGGKRINITSIVGHTGNIGQANYAASKACLIGMSKSLALEYGRKNIKVNCISPGFIKSEMTDKIAVMYAGSIVEIGPTKQVFESPKHSYTKALLDSTPSIRGEKKKLRSLEGEPPSLINKIDGCSFSPRCPTPTNGCKNQSIEMGLVKVGNDHYADKCCSECTSE